jgi:hypothetical protein
MTDAVVKRGGHYLLLVAAGLAAVSATTLGASAPSIFADPESGLGAVVPTLVVAAIDLFLAGLLGWAAFRADRGGVIGVSVAAIVLALLVGVMVLDGAFAASNHAYSGARTTAVLFSISVAANALVVLSAVLELIFGKQRRGTSTSKPGVA